MKVSSIKGSDWIVAIGGFILKHYQDPKTIVRSVSGDALPALVQLMDADYIAGYNHLHLAVINAVKAMESGAALSKNITVEILLYASARDQITKALEVVGLTPQTERVALVLLTKNIENIESFYRNVAKLLGREDDSKLNLNQQKMDIIMELFGINKLELETAGGPSSLSKLIIEKGALLRLK